ncbi:aminopeptidase N C-terminal domain-containing protein, partial [Nostoc sp. NIES-2111]
NRWQAAQTFALRLLIAGFEAAKALGAPRPDPRFAVALGALLASTTDDAFAAQVMTLPSETDIAREIGSEIDPDAVLAARRALRASVGRRIADTLEAVYASRASSETYSPDARSAGRRALRNAALDLLAAGDPERGAVLASRQFEAADNMTDRFAALATLSLIPGQARGNPRAAFARRHAGGPLGLGKWFALQAAIPGARALDRLRALMGREGFSLA